MGILLAAWTVLSLVGAAFFFWLRPHVPTRRMIVVVRAADRRRVVAVSGRRRAAQDRVVAEIDPESHLIMLPHRRVPTADPAAPVVLGGRLRYDIVDPGKAAAAAEPLAVALGDGIIAAVDEPLRDLPLAQALSMKDDLNRRLIEALRTMRVYGVAVTEVELTTFTGPDGLVWGAPPTRAL